MNRTFRRLLLWLLMAVLPIQGLAAVMKATCGPNHQSSLPAAAAEDHHHAGHAAPSRHHDATGHPAAGEQIAQTADVSISPQDNHAGSYCSACAACCVGAGAPPPAMHRTLVHSSSAAVKISPAPLVTGFIPDGLERPPRPISA
jgi:hypothetical protein